jgi:hypothetical protein
VNDHGYHHGAINIAAGNLPRPTRDPRKRDLLPGPRRARATGRIMTENRIDRMGAAEVWSDFRDTVREDMPRYGITSARANEVFPRCRIFNADITNVRDWRRDDRRNINIPWADRPKVGLNLVASLATRRSDGFQETNIPLHLPSQGAAPDAVWERMLRQVLDYAASIDGPVTISGDFNRGRKTVERIAAEYGFTVGAWIEVMGVLVKGFKVLGERVITVGYHGRLSDHDGLPIAELLPEDLRRQDRLPPTHQGVSP